MLDIIVMIVNFCEIHFWPIYFITFGMYVGFIICLVAAGEYEEEVGRALFWFSVVPIINYVVFIAFVIIAVLKLSSKKLEDISIKRNKKYDLKNMEYKKQIKIIKKALIAGSYFKNEREIIDFVEGFNMTQKLLGKEDE